MKKRKTSMTEDEIRLKLIGIAATVNSLRQKYKAPFTEKDLSGRLYAASVPYYKQVAALLVEKGLEEVRDTEYGKLYQFNTNPIHYTFFRDIFETISPEDEDGTIDRFTRLLLDIQFYQRKDTRYSLEALLKEYNIYTFPKKNIPDLTKMIIDKEGASKLYKELVINYRDNLVKRKTSSVDRDNNSNEITEMLNNVRLIRKDQDVIAKYILFTGRKVDAIIRHFKINLDRANFEDIFEHFKNI